MSCFTTGGPGKEHGTSKPPPTGSVWERSKGDTTCLITSQNPSRWHPSWLSDACATRKDSNQNDWLKTTRKESHQNKTRDCEPCGRPVLLGSLPSALHWVPLPNKISCFVSTCVSLDNSFTSVRQEPTFRPWKGSPFLQ